ncbi:hypothetical protein [Rhizobium binae]|uniref:hypothetical protein n=1 Tax=Rhizobium binae TaxID=1138190 RepID=UPI001FEE66E5|nr:hypothetical protein [Rhizobium binae]
MLVSYRATPSAGFHLPRLAQASYDDRATFSAEVLKEIVPKITTANGIDAATLRTEVMPGGYLLKTNASLQTEGDLDDAGAGRLAGSLGYVFRQYRVLTSRLNDTTGKTGFVVVRFPQGSLNATSRRDSSRQRTQRKKAWAADMPCSVTSRSSLMQRIPKESLIADSMTQVSRRIEPRSRIVWQPQTNGFFSRQCDRALYWE